MDITGIQNRNEVTNVIAQTGSDPMSLGSQGEIVEGIVSKVSNQISINFNGTEIHVPQSAVQNAKEGEIRKYRIMDVSDKGIVLKEMGSSPTDGKKGSIFFTVVETGRMNFLTKNSTLTKIQERIESGGLSDRITEDDVEELEKEGMSLEKYESERLERAIERIKSQRTFKEESLENYINKKKEEKENIEKIALKNQLPKGIPDLVIERMWEEDIPITEENVKRAANACRLADSVTNISDCAMRFLLQNEREPTITNLYLAKFSGIQTGSASQDGPAWDQVKDQVKRVISEAGYAINKTNMDRAKWLFLNELPISAEVLGAQETLISIRDTNDSRRNMECIVNAMSKGDDPETALLDGRMQETARRVVEDLKNIREESIAVVHNKNQSINLKNLREVERQNLQPFTADKKSPETADIEVITAKRRLEEVRLKMTVEAANRLQKQGINLDTDPLERLVEGLRVIENQYYEGIFLEAGESGSAEGVSLLRSTTEAVQQLQMAPAHVLGIHYHKSGLETIRELHAESVSLSDKLNRAGDAYEKLMTAPRRDMGDSIQKAFQNVDDILKDLDFECNDTNRRAVRILGYNGIEITKDSIEKMKDADAAVNYMLRNLHPAVTVNLIKEDKNPLNMPMDELNREIRKQRNQLGISGEERFSKYLWQLEKEEGMTQDERDSYIGIYRMLNQIQKTDGAVIGAVIEAGGELTLDHLMTAVRTRRSGGIKAEIDDDFGVLESVTRGSKTITEQVNQGFSNTYYQNLVQDITNQMTPDKWKEILREVDGKPLEVSLETLREKLDQAEGSTESRKGYYKEKTEQIRELLNNSKDARQFLESFEISPTLENISAAVQMSDQGQNILKKLLERSDGWSDAERNRLEEAADGLVEALVDKETMQAQESKVEEAVRTILKGQEERILTYEDMNRLRILEGGIRLHARLSAKESYEIPLVTEEGITNINLTIVRNSSEKGKLHMDIDSPVLGRITVDFTLKGNKIKGTMLCEDLKAQRRLQECNLVENIKSDGYEIVSLNIGREDWKSTLIRNNIREQEEDNTDTKMIYCLAKNIITTIRGSEHDAAEQEMMMVGNRISR